MVVKIHFKDLVTIDLNVRKMTMVLRKIWITKKQNNSKGQILINNRELPLNLIERTEINEIFKIKGENLRLEIARATDTIKGIYKNKVFSVYCIKNSFKM